MLGSVLLDCRPWDSVHRRASNFSSPHLHGHENTTANLTWGEGPVGLGFFLPSVEDSLFQERDGFSEPGRITVPFHLGLLPCYLALAQGPGLGVQEGTVGRRTAFMDGKESAPGGSGGGVSGYWVLQ